MRTVNVTLLEGRGLVCVDMADQRNTILSHSQPIENIFLGRIPLDLAIIKNDFTFHQFIFPLRASELRRTASFLIAYVARDAYGDAIQLPPDVDRRQEIPRAKCLHCHNREKEWEGVP